MIAGEVSESEEDVLGQTTGTDTITEASSGTAAPLACTDEPHLSEGQCDSSSDGQKLMMSDEVPVPLPVPSKITTLEGELVPAPVIQEDHNGTFGNISPRRTAIGTCEDNLHGLSLTNSLRSNDEVEYERFAANSSEKKCERLNPFNATGTDRILQNTGTQQRESSFNFVPLDGLGNDEIMASFIPNELYFMKMNRLQKSKEETSTALSNPCENELSDSSIELNLPRIKTEASDPWVKHTPEHEAISPVVGDDPIPSRVLSKVESDASEDRGPEDGGTKQNSLYSGGGLKKAPAIEPNPNAMVLDIPGPCEPEDLIEGIIFSASYLGTTQLVSNRNPAKNARMFQAQEAVNRIKAPDGESQPTVQVDLFISTSKIKILNAETQETMMSHTLRSISYIADIGDLLVIMAKRPVYNDEESKDGNSMQQKDQQKRHRVICHVLSSSDSHLIAESIGQCFNVAYQQFLHSNCIEPQNLTQDDFNNLLDTQEMYHDDLVHYSKEENVKEIWLEKKKGETVGIAVVESGWGSIIPTVILANMQHGSPVERNGKFSIGDQIMAINGTSMVGLPLQTCHSIIKGLRNQTLIKINIVSCPPVVSVLIKRPNLKHQLGFSVQNGIICSLMRGGIAERGGVRVGHRIIEINDQSIVATPHDKIVQMLVTSVGEIQMKTMPAAMYRLLTGQEQPIFL